ncbi:MAG TPA: hypothetical protein VGB64_12480 [Actinomycetota bacterium]
MTRIVLALLLCAFAPACTRSETPPLVVVGDVIPNGALEIQAEGSDEPTLLRVPYREGETFDFVIDAANHSDAKVQIVGFDETTGGMAVPVEYRVELHNGHAVDFLGVTLEPGQFVRVVVRLLFTACERYQPGGRSTLNGLSYRYHVGAGRDRSSFLSFSRLIDVESPLRESCPRKRPPNEYSGDDAVWPA